MIVFIVSKNKTDPSHISAGSVGSCEHRTQATGRGVCSHCSVSCHIMGRRNNTSQWNFQGKVGFLSCLSFIESLFHHERGLEEILQISEKLNEIMKRSVFVNEIFRKYYDVSGSFLTLSCSFTKTNVIHRLWQGWRITFILMTFFKSLSSHLRQITMKYLEYLRKWKGHKSF